MVHTLVYDTYTILIRDARHTHYTLPLTTFAVLPLQVDLLCSLYSMWPPGPHGIKRGLSDESVSRSGNQAGIKWQRFAIKWQSSGSHWYAIGNHVVIKMAIKMAITL